MTDGMGDTVLCLNAGSSSIKFELFEVDRGDGLKLCFRGQLQGIGTGPRLLARDAEGRSLADQVLDAQEVSDTGAAVPALMAWLGTRLDGTLPAVIGHRVVFGGTRYATPVEIDAQVLAHLRSLVPFMPLHLPPELMAIEIIRKKLPELPQVAVFDTGFHQDRHPVVERLPVPEELHDDGLRRYGYHGISYEYISSRLPEVAPDIARGRVVVAHLGSGCSMCALVDGRSVETSMGFSTLDGLPMGTRPGRFDPGAVLYLLQARGMSVAEVEEFLYKQCGLKGLSGISNDVRELLATDDPRAEMALDFFSLCCARMIAELATVMGGIDGLVFTAGVGEKAAQIRADIGDRLAWLGMQIDATANAAHGPRISGQQSRVACYVVPTHEELIIARHSLALLRSRDQKTVTQMQIPP